MRQPAGLRSDFRWFADISLRWNDIDIFGHVNNARYYEFFDTAVVRFLHEIDAGFGKGEVAMVVVENGCRFHREIVFADRVQVGVKLDHLGTSSVRYGLAVFANDDEAARADGHFVHVFIDPQTKRPTPVTPQFRAHLETISI